MRKTVLLLLLAAACSPSDSTGSTASSSAPPSSAATPPSITTPTTTPSTTTIPATNTTKPRPTTTTAPPLAGNWADGPVIVTEFGALGWWDGSGWLDAETAGALPVVGGEDYQVTRLGELSMTTAGPQTIVCEPLGLIGVELADPSLLGEFPGPYGVAVSAPWPIQPYVFEEIADDGSYAEFASQLLADRGLQVPDPVIKQLYRTDIEGDGVDEVLVVAEDVPPSFLMEAGDYSIAFMQKVIDGETRTAILGETIAVGEEDQFSGAYSFGGAADLNGDARMEIITNAAFFEGLDVTVWEYPGDDVGAVLALQLGCGV